MIEFQMPTLAFSKYEPDPKSICILCKDSHPAERLITCPDEIRICINCSDILGECASERKEKIREEAAQEMLDIFSCNAATGKLSALKAIYDAGYRKVE